MDEEERRWFAEQRQAIKKADERLEEARKNQEEFFNSQLDQVDWMEENRISDKMKQDKE